MEILGWLYQFYISEKKDAVMARKSAVPTEDIPAVTQLFTPHWIVRYLVENSLGRLWLLNRPNSRLRDSMPYYIEDKDEGGSMKDEANSSDPSSFIIHNSSFLRVNKPEEIRLVDPAVGSGHMLTYAFDLLTLIYEEEGYTPSEIPALILRHNLHGLEICPRAAQLAELALVFKAREKSRRFFQPDHLVRPNITELQDIRFDEGELAAYFKAINSQPSTLNSQLLQLLHQFEESKNFGSLIQPCLSEAEVQSVRSAIQHSKSNIQNSDLMVGATHLKVLRVLEQAEALTQRYHIVVANPPYMGSGYMSLGLRDFALAAYPNSRSDLYSMMTEQGLNLIASNGILAVVTMQSWMFLASFREFRANIFLANRPITLIQIGYNSFPELNSKIAQAAAFVLQRSAGKNHRCVFFNLNDVGQSEDKDAVFLSKKSAGSCYRINPSDLKQVPGYAIAYWLKRFDIFSEANLGKKWISGGRIKTHDGARYIRFHWEIVTTSSRWRPLIKGGAFRKFYGNEDYVLDWSPEAVAFYDSHGGLRPRRFDDKEGICWSKITSALPSFRIKPSHVEYDSASPTIFNGSFKCDTAVLGFLNSSVCHWILNSINPTLNLQVADVLSLPLMLPSNEALSKLTEDTASCIELSRADWDSFETSRDFRDQPLLRPGLKGATLEASWRNWEAQSTAAIRRMQELETENNRLFIAAYGLEGELQPEVPEDQITLARADQRKDIAAFLSYAVGVMFGRYSLQVPGLVLADAGGTVEDYWRIVRTKDEGRRMKDEEKQDSDASDPNFILHNSSFILPDEDGILPILDGEWFEDDIVARIREFLRATFGEATLKQNLRFIEDSLGKPLEKYFLTDFYKDHLQTYKKRPIYWLFQSPKKGFSALVYVHRYTKDTVNTLLNKYLRDYLKKLESRIAYLTQEEATATATKDKTAARKEREKLQKALKDCQDWERNTILPLAQARLEIDLDDGVKVNYLKFTGAVQPIAGLAAKED